MWLVGPGAIAGPWLPSPQQQDEAWLRVFAEHMQKSAVNRSFMRCVAESIDGRQR